MLPMCCSLTWTMPRSRCCFVALAMDNQGAISDWKSSYGKAGVMLAGRCGPGQGNPRDHAHSESTALDFGESRTSEHRLVSPHKRSL